MLAAPSALLTQDGYARRQDAVLTAPTFSAVVKWLFPRILVLCMPSIMRPRSVVRVVKTSGWAPPMLIRPTEDSGFDWVLAEKMKLTASDWASKREGLGQVVFVRFEPRRGQAMCERHTCNRHSGCARCCRLCWAIRRAWEALRWMWWRRTLL